MSSQFDEECERLAVAEKHIADSEQQLVELIKRAEDIGDHGGNLETIKNAMATLDIMLIEWRTQRDLVAERVGKLRVLQK